MKDEYLNENKYKKASGSLFFVGIGIIIIGIVAFLFLFIPKIKKTDSTNKVELQQKLNALRPGLEEKYNALKEKGVTESFDYKNKEGYEMYLIDIALDPTYGKCEHSGSYSDNDITREYCSIKAEIYDIDHAFHNDSIIPALVPALMALMPCLAIGTMLIMVSKQRQILAYQAQSVLPVAKEVVEDVAPTMGKAAGKAFKELKPTMQDMVKDAAPMYGEVAKEIAKGIKEGLKEDNKDEK